MQFEVENSKPYLHGLLERMLCESIFLKPLKLRHFF